MKIFQTLIFHSMDYPKLTSSHAKEAAVCAQVVFSYVAVALLWHTAFCLPLKVSSLLRQ